MSARMPSKRGGNSSLHRFLRLFIPFKFIFHALQIFFDSQGDNALPVDHRSALKGKPCKLLRGLASPTGFEPVLPP